MSKKNTSKERSYLWVAFVSLIWVIVFEKFWPDMMPFTMFQFFNLSCPFFELLNFIWFFLVLAFVSATVVFIRHRNDGETFTKSPWVVFGSGLLVSLWAGVMEEVCFRWLIFYGQIIVYKILDWCFFGVLGWGFFSWFFVNISGPFSNFLTLGFLQTILIGGNWAVGSAMLTANGRFRDGHAYQGAIGFIRSWFFGMVMFYLMFNYGLIAAILIHFLYDFFCFSSISFYTACMRVKKND